MKPKVSVIILNYNGKNDTLECLESVYKIDYCNYDVIVVDNGSTDGSINAVHLNFPDAEIIETGENLGFAGGVNRGISYALNKGAEYIMLLNNDAIIEEHALFLLAEKAKKDKTIGAIGPLILYRNNEKQIWSCGGKIDWFRGLWVNDFGSYNKQNNGYDTDALSGCAILFNAAALRKCGLFDEKYFLYGEDVDICLRLKKSGFRVICLPEARVLHKVGKTIGSSDSAKYIYYITRNRFYLMKKHAAHYKWMIFLFYSLYSQTRNYFHFKSAKKFDNARAITKGCLDYFNGRLGALTEEI